MSRSMTPESDATVSSESFLALISNARGITPAEPPISFGLANVQCLLEGWDAGPNHPDGGPDRHCRAEARFVKDRQDGPINPAGWP